MSEFLIHLRLLVAELTRRRVVHAVAAYAAVAWVGVQVTKIVMEALFLPPVTLTVAAFVALLGFPVVVALTWAFEFSPEGIRRTRRSPAARRLSLGARGAFAAAVILATAAVGWVGWEQWLGPRAEELEAAARTSPADSAAGTVGTDEPAPELASSKVAVLYFDDFSPGDTLTALAEGLTEHVIHRLAQVKALDVVSRNGVAPYRENPPTIDSVARALGAGSLVEGSVSPAGEAGDSLQVSVQLIDGETQDHLMSAMVQQPAAQVFALQDSLARQVATLLRKRLGRQVRVESWRAETESAEAWRLLQRADRLREDAEQKKMSGHPELARELFARADALLADAESLDPGWSAPKVERARLVAARLPSPFSGAWEGEHRRLARRGIAYADEALAGDSASAAALRLRGQLRFWLSQNIEDPERSATLVDRAEKDLRAAVREDEGSARAWYALSELFVEGREDYERGRYYAGRAQKADAFLELPLETTWQFFMTALGSDDYEEAAHWCRRGQRQYPTRVRFLNCELQLLATEGGLEPDVERAWSLVEEIVAQAKESNRARFAAVATPKVAAVLARAGQADSARAVLRRVSRDSPAERWPFVYMQKAHARVLLGEEERAVDLLAEYLERNPGERADVRTDDWFEPLRDRPRFRELVGAQQPTTSGPARDPGGGPVRN